MSVGSVKSGSPVAATVVGNAPFNSASTSSSSSATGYGYSGASSFGGSSGASASSGASEGQPSKEDWNKAIMNTIIHIIETNMDKAQQEFKKAYKNGL